jgi:hypothetical protein
MNSTPDRVSTRRRFTTGTVARVLAGGIAAGSVVGLFATAAPASAANEPHKSYVCKYVDKPGEAERLQTGQNPIWVDNNSLLGYDGTVTVGQQFKDGQIKSVVLVANTDKLNPEPSIDDCPAPAPPTTTTSTTSTTSTSSTTSSTTNTTATLIPPKTSTTTSSTSTSSKTTPVTPSSTTATTPATVTTLYPLQPVKAGVTTDATANQVTVTPLRVALVLLVLFGLWVAFGGRLPHVRRVGSPRDGS